MQYKSLFSSLQVSNNALSSVVIILFGCFIWNGCQAPETSEDQIDIEWSLSPTPPVVGASTLQITLSDTAGQPVEHADVTLEANMSHPGMAPVTGRAVEVEPGRYSGEFNFTMGGDWYILIEATLDDDRVIERQITVSGVRSD